MNLNLVQDELTFFGLNAGLTNFYVILNKTGPVVTNPPWDGIVGMTNNYDGSVFQNLVNVGLERRSFSKRWMAYEYNTNTCFPI